MTEHERAALDGWRRLEAAARETGNDVLADQAKHFGDLLEFPPAVTPSPEE